MPKPHDRDELLASLQDELRVTINTLNQLYHPVNPPSAERVKALEARVSEIRAAIAERRTQLAAPADA